MLVFQATLATSHRLELRMSMDVLKLLLVELPQTSRFEGRQRGQPKLQQRSRRLKLRWQSSRPPRSQL